jgi:hypothetical protein
MLLLSAKSAVEQLLATAAVTPNEAEVAAMVEAFTLSREAIDALYLVPGVRYEVPGLGFSGEL